MRSLNLLMIACALGLSACAAKAPTAYCPYPPIPSQAFTDAILDNAGVVGNIYLNQYKNHLCKFWRVYDNEEYKKHCENTTK